MKVKELIESLEKLDPELELFDYGYEGGYEPITGLEKCTLIKDVHDEWWYGPHERADNVGVTEYDKEREFVGVIIK